jgi:hypothetical protein
LYISREVSYFYSIDFEIWAGFGQNFCNFTKHPTFRGFFFSNFYGQNKYKVIRLDRLNTH